MYRLLILINLLYSCGYKAPKDQCVGNGTKCKETSDGESVTVIEYRTGDRGLPGKDGSSCSITQVSSGAEIRCEDGTTVEIRNGNQGPAGRDGKDGADGSSCSATRVSNGVEISCTDGTHAVVIDGTAGADGEDGQDAPPTAYSVVEMRDPCGKQTSFDEILMRTANGKWIAHFSSGGNQFLTVLTPGTYVTTDGTHCYFTLNNDGTITGEHN